MTLVLDKQELRLIARHLVRILHSNYKKDVRKLSKISLVFKEGEDIQRTQTYSLEPQEINKILIEGKRCADISQAKN